MDISARPLRDIHITHHVGVTNVAVKVLPKVAKDQQNCLTANMGHGWGLRPSENEKCVLTSRPERCTVFSKIQE